MTRPTALNPVKLTVWYTDPDADPSVFENCLVRPDGAFLVVNDLTKTPRVAHLIPAHGISVATGEEIVVKLGKPIAGQVDA